MVSDNSKASLSLPSELLDLIFESLSDSTPALQACSLVSTTWHSVAAARLFSSLSILCAIDQPNPAVVLPKHKRHFGLAYGVVPVYRRKRTEGDSAAHCACENYKDCTAQSFHSSGAYSSIPITRNVSHLRLIFCSSEGHYGPHSLQLFPDCMISDLLRLVDAFSFTRLRSLTIEHVPSALYFLTGDPFRGVLSSCAASLEEISFTGFHSMQDCNVQRILTRHALSCLHFPCLRRITFEGHSWYGPSSDQTLRWLLRFVNGRSAVHGLGVKSVTVDVMYHYERPCIADGYAKFEIHDRCCVYGSCDPESHRHSLAQDMGIGAVDWSLPAIGAVMRAIQADALGRYAGVLEFKVSSFDPWERLSVYALQTFRGITSLSLCFDSVVDLGDFLRREPGSIMRTLVPFADLRTFTVSIRADIFRSDLQTEGPLSILDTMFVELSQSMPRVGEVCLEVKGTTPLVPSTQVQEMFNDEWMLRRTRAVRPGFLTVKLATTSSSLEFLV